MSKLFFSSASEYLSIASAVVTTTPFTMACWYYSYDIGFADDLVLMDLHASGSSRFANCYQMAISGFSGTPFGVVLLVNATSDAASTAVQTPFRWQHAAGVFAASSDRRAFLNGGFKGVGTGDDAPAGINTTTIGRVSGSAPAAYMWGRIAHAAIWNVALEDAEVSMLAQGVLPIQIRVENLKAYWPLTYGAPVEWRNRFNLTATGTRAASDPPAFAKEPFFMRLPTSVVSVSAVLPPRPTIVSTGVDRSFSW